MNPSQQYHIHWRNHKPNFISVFTQLLNSESLVDVTLSADGKQIQAHRVVLSACSSYFQELFVTNPCQHPIVILKDVNYKDLCTIIHFMYYGEVNFAQEHLDSVLKTAEALQVKGFSDVIDSESLSSALTQESPVILSGPPSIESDESGPKRKRLRNSSANNAGSSNQSPHISKSQESQSSGDSRSLSMKSMSSSDGSSVIKEKTSITEQNSIDAASGSFNRDDAEEGSLNTAANGKTSSSSWAVATRTNGSTSLDSGTDGSILSAKAKRHRPLIRQQCVKKESEKESQGIADDNLSLPTAMSSLQPILPKTSAPGPSSESSGGFSKTRTQALLQLPQTSHLPRQRSQPILPSQSSTYSTPSSSPSPVSGGNSNTVQPISFISANIPTLAVTPVSSSSNIVIEPFPTILRVVSIEDVSSGGFHDTPASTPVLTRTPSQTAPTTSTLQVPTASDAHPASSSQGINRLKAKSEDGFRRSVSNPGTSPTGTSSSRSGHCPELRTGAALGCNYCWNTVDNHGRILRRKTKYHCPECQANLCIVPCFQEYHEKFTPSSDANAGGTGNAGSGPKGSAQQLSKMSSI